jgi:hypothetical protein
MLGWSGCASGERTADPPGGEGGSVATGGARGGSGGSRTGGAGGGTGGGSAATGGAGGGSGGSQADASSAGTGGATAMDAPSGPRDSAAVDVAAADMAGSSPTDSGMSPSADGPPAAGRPDVMGAACASGTNYGFTVRPFTSQRGTFTAYFTATPSRAPTNSVIGLSDGQKYLHDDYAAIVRFGTSGNLDVRNGTAYSSATPIKYEVTDYHFRLVVDVPAHKYSAYVSFKGMPEVTLGTDLAFRDSAGVPAQFSHWGVEAIAGHVTRVCNFLVQ